MEAAVRCHTTTHRSPSIDCVWCQRARQATQDAKTAAAVDTKWRERVKPLVDAIVVLQTADEGDYLDKYAFYPLYEALRQFQQEQPEMVKCPSTSCINGKSQIAGSGLGDTEVDCELCGGMGKVPRKKPYLCPGCRQFTYRNIATPRVEEHDNTFATVRIWRCSSCGHTEYC